MSPRRRGGITLSLVMLAFAAAIAYAAVTYQRQVAEEAVQAARDDLELLLELRKSALEQYLSSMLVELKFWSETPALSQRLKAVVDAWDSFSDDAGAALQRLYAYDNPTVLRPLVGPERAAGSFDYGTVDIFPGPASTLRRLYIHGNPNLPGKRDSLDSAGDGSEYSTVHAQFHARARRFLRDRGYYDLFLIDPRGNVVYSVHKEDDFGTNLVNGPYSESGLAEVFRAVRDSVAPGAMAFSDFTSYTPSAGAPAAFVAISIYDEDDPLILLGMLGLQVPLVQIDDIMQFSAGLGESGKIYLIGTDYLFRSDTGQTESSSVLRVKADTVAVRRALLGDTGVVEGKDYRDIEVISAFSLIEFLGVTWAIVAEIDMQEVNGRSKAAFDKILVPAAAAIGVLLVIATAALAWALLRGPKE